MSVNVVEDSTENHNPVEERCDRCGARGYVKLTKLDNVLVFCNHHSREFQGSLTMNGWVAISVEMQ